MNDLFPFLDFLPLALLFKVLTLLIIFLYTLFIFIALVQVRALNRLVEIKAGGESLLVQVGFLLYFLLVLSLFLLAIAIL